MAFKLTVIALLLAFAYLASAAPEKDKATEAEFSTQVEPKVEAETPDEKATDVSYSDQETTLERQILFNKLFSGYNKNTNPSNVEVKHGIAVMNMNYCTSREMVIVDMFARYLWKDDRLTWDPSEHGGIKNMRVPAENVWIPDIMLYNSATSNPGRCQPTNTIVRNTGHVIWVPPCVENVACGNLTLDREPFAEQSCTLKYGSWTFDAHSLVLKPFMTNKPEADIEHQMGTTEWVALGSTAKRVDKKYDCCEEPYTTMEYTIRFQRKAAATCTN